MLHSLLYRIHRMLAELTAFALHEKITETVLQLSYLVFSSLLSPLYYFY
jgi:hypothetical protein